MSSVTPTEKEPLHVVVVVLGDLGRSPRMQYHTQSLLEAGHCVTLVGYTGEALIPALLAPKYAERLSVIRFWSPKVKVMKTHALLFYYAWRILSLTVLLAHALWIRVHRSIQQFSQTKRNQNRTHVVLVQNPPAVPLLALAWVYCRMHQAKLVIDWHNLGYSMISLGGPVRAFAKWYEINVFGPMADAHLTVTYSLQSYLQQTVLATGTTSTTKATHPIPCQVLHDSPPSQFRLRTLAEQHAILSSLDAQLRAACPSHWNAVDKDLATQTLFTEEYSKKKYRPRPGRPALVVSSTSWTPDEDISILLDALEGLDLRITTAAESSSSPLRIVCVITGKGPLREHYQERISKMKLQHIAIATLWMEPADYPKYLACADLGVSLHTSTSGRDLPIKILDYFGCEVPVCAYEFECLHELVQDDVNGRTFTRADDLSNILWDLLSPLGQEWQKKSVGNHDFGDLKRYSLQVQGRALWSEQWPKIAQPLIEGVVRNAKK